ncbi:MAG: TonB-dependent receptor plug domain-containing protein [Nitrososphaera sp.]|nr:TonB-dependent receptor plug domain-containing protein [Nitrososphaera sp.]MCI0707766.1 TonB-dependent receptor plug domain-containing protein [Ignavibacteriota bacterium]
MEQLQWRYVRHALLTTVLLVLANSLVFAFQTEAVVRGVVTESESGQPLVGVTIILTGTTVGTTTNSDGFYSLRIVPGYNVIQYSFVGFKTQRENIDNRTEINVRLQSDVLKLDEVLVTGYGTTPRRQVTSSVSQIARDNIGDFAPVTVDQLLQGRATGVQFTSTSGLIGAPTNVRIRGAASISASTAPLYVIDGVPVTNPTTAGSSSIGLLAGGQGINPLLNINPNDIESIEVLKDAAASAIYGSRGSNGVILISTRQGRPDQQVINIRTYAGSVEPTNNYEMMNGEEFTRIWNDAVVNAGASNTLLLPTTNIVNTDWTDLVSQTGTLTETSASITGGTQRTRYFLSGTYRSEEGFVQRSQIKRYSGRARIDHAVSDQVRIGLNLSPSRTDNNRIYTSNAVAAPFTYAALYYPNVPARNPDGSANLTVTPNPFTQFSGTPLSNVEGIDFSSSLTQLLSTATVEYNILRGLVFNTELSVDLF